MCYDMSYMVKSQVKEALHRGMNKEEAERLKNDIHLLNSMHTNELQNGDWPAFHHINGFAHPPLIAFYAVHPFKAIAAEWGFVPHWVKTQADAYHPSQPYNHVLNAQSATVFDKPAFGKAARYGRCVILISGYYESHHYKGKTYPFYIYRKDKQPMYIAAICRKAKWVDEETGELVQKNVLATLTCEANATLSRIHNNPKMVQRGNGHRMLVILKKEDVSRYLKPYPFAVGENGDPDEALHFQKEILTLCKPFPDDELSFHSVAPLKERKNQPYLGNVPEIKDVYEWPDFDYGRVKP